jgi:hypothetical protein
MPKLTELKEASNDPRLQKLVGKNCIVGIHQFYKDDLVRHSQDFGQFACIEDGMMILQTESGKSRFPIQYEAFIPAPRGQYVLKSNGSTISNPDFLVSWRLDLDDNLELSQWTINTAPLFASIVGEEFDFEYVYDKRFIKEIIKSRSGDYIDKTVIAGITEFVTDENGTRKIAKKYQIFGDIVRVSISEGIVLKLKNQKIGEEFILPPDLTMLQPAPPGNYKFRSSKENIINPDYMTIWEVDIKNSSLIKT